MSQFVVRNGIASIVDVGCGDFRVGRALLSNLDPVVDYAGIDVSDIVIESLQGNVDSPGVTFLCLDAVDERPPEADLVLCREVLQHLSNRDAAKLVDNCLSVSRFAIFTNSAAVAMREPNLDVPTGAMSRVAINSGIDLGLPPFNLHPQLLVRVPHSNGKAVIESVVVGGER